METQVPHMKTAAQTEFLWQKSFERATGWRDPQSETTREALKLEFDRRLGLSSAAKEPLDCLLTRCGCPGNEVPASKN